MLFRENDSCNSFMVSVYILLSHMASNTWEQSCFRRRFLIAPLQRVFAETKYRYMHINSPCNTVPAFMTSQPIRWNRTCTHAHTHTHCLIGREIMKYAPLLLEELIMQVGHLLPCSVFLIAGGGHLSLLSHKRAMCVHSSSTQNSTKDRK